MKYSNSIKVFSFLLLSLSSAFANAEPCLQNICFDDLVIDHVNYTGRVVGINTATGKILYQRDGYSGSEEAIPSNLSKKIISDRFPVGKKVLDQTNYSGVVVNAFENGKIVYTRDGYSGTEVSSKLSPEVPQVSGITTGNKVLDKYNYVGTAKTTFEDGRIQYTRDGYSGTEISKDLVVEIPSANSISKGVTIIDRFNYIGVAKTVFADKRVQYTRNGYSGTEISSEVWPEVAALGNLKANVRVIDNYNYRGIVLAVFQNNKINYSRDGYSGTEITARENLSPSVAAVSGISAKLTVIDRYNYVGSVVEVFADGRICYNRNGYSGTEITKELVLASASLQDGNYKTGTLIVDRYNYVGKVILTFADGRVQYNREGYSGTEITNVSDLSYEVNTIEGATYSKDVEYASDSNQIGKPIHFFKNGKIQISGESGSSVTSILYNEVPSLSGITAGTQIVTPDKTAHAVNRIFENATVVYGVEDVQTHKILNRSSRLLLNEALTSKVYVAMWVQDLIIAKLNGREQTNHSYSNALLAKDYPIFKLLVVEVIEKDDFLSKKQKRDLVDFVSADL